jgi:hypothetical protein
MHGAIGHRVWAICGGYIPGALLSTMASPVADEAVQHG